MSGVSTNGRALRYMGAMLFPVLLGVIWLELYGRYGINGADDGFITGLSFRLTQGQVPYRDFIYVRPPASIVLHAVPLLVLPPSWQVLFERFGFYFFVAVYSLVSAVILERRADLRELGLGRYLAAALFFVGSVQSFPPTPWHTIDGILLGTAGIYFLACSATVRGTLGAALFLFLAALTKQSFFFMVPFALAYALATRTRRDTAILAGGLGGLAAAFVGGLAWCGLLPDFVEQVRGGAKLSSLVHSGFLAYLRALSPVAAAGLLAFVILERAARWIGGPRRRSGWLPFVVLGVIFATSIVSSTIAQRFQAPLFNYPALLFVATLAGVLIEMIRGRSREHGSLLLMLGLAWCASLSWGYPTPALYAAPFLFGVLALSRRYLGTNARALAIHVLVLSLAAQFAGYRYPYREAPRAELDHDLGDVFVQLSGIHTSRENHEKYAELGALHGKYGDDFAVLPGMTLAHYLTGSKPVLGVGWALNSECAGRVETLRRELELHHAYVLLEKDSSFLCESGPACSSLAAYVRDHGTAVERGRFFDVYRLAD